MKELLEYYSEEGELIGCMEKKRMHEMMKEEYKKKGKVSVRHKDVRLILMTSQGKIILQRRSKWKGSNRGLWDKTIGGHIVKDDIADLTMLKECSEELGIPSTVVSNEVFEKTCATTNLNILGVLTKLTYLDNFQSKRTYGENKSYTEPSMTQFYIGYYDGPIRFIDGESSGIQLFSPDELIDEIKETPKLFTEDLKYIIKKFRNNMVPAPEYKMHELND
jgi:isopentenyldiphosphate isomerase